MTTDIVVGQEMMWHHVVSNYGHIDCVRVKIVKVGKRITIEAPMRRGGTRKTVVTRERLHPIKTVLSFPGDPDLVLSP